MADPITPKDLVDIAKIYLSNWPAGLYHRSHAPGANGYIMRDGKLVAEITIESDNTADAVARAEGLVATLCMMLNNRA